MFKQYADEVMEFVKKLEADGARLPGTDEEKAACKKIQGELKARTGITPTTEKFTYAADASIGAINRIGWVAVITFILYYLGGAIGGSILAIIGCVGMLGFTLTQIVVYTGMWDFCFKQSVSENIVTEIPSKGETKFTVYLGAHYDSCWCWKLAARNPNTAIPKTAYGIVGVVVLLGLSIARLCYYFDPMAKYSLAFEVIGWVLPVAFLPGFFFLTQYLTHDKNVGSPGAMDNLSGVGINMMIMKYFMEHPEDMPEGMKLVNICTAAEESSLKGSAAYVKAHAAEMDKPNTYFINVDSVADPGHFEAVKGDPWQFTHFDETLIKYICESIDESGEKSHVIVNPVGGCDSTPWCKAGIATVTFAAQNPVSTDYYHTYKDRSDRIDVGTFEIGLNVVYKTIKKIAAGRGVVSAPVSEAPVEAPVTPAAEAPVTPAAEAPVEAPAQEVAASE